jgi:hypothetical protein
MAEGVGFEPTVGYPTLDFESSALNRTQPPFRDYKRTSNPPTPKASAWQALNVQRRTSNAKYHADDPVCEEAVLTSTAAPRVASSFMSRAGLGRPDFSPHEGKKCYNFRLAMSGKFTASCMSTRTATLLLVVDRYSQVLGGAVHQYCQLIRTSTPPLLP